MTNCYAPGDRDDYMSMSIKKPKYERRMRKQNPEWGKRQKVPWSGSKDLSNEFNNGYILVIDELNQYQRQVIEADIERIESFATEFKKTMPPSGHIKVSQPNPQNLPIKRRTIPITIRKFVRSIVE